MPYSLEELVERVDHEECILESIDLERLLKHGFDYESSMMGNDYMPYRVRQGDVIAVAVRVRHQMKSCAVSGQTSVTTCSYYLPATKKKNCACKRWCTEFKR